MDLLFRLCCLLWLNVAVAVAQLGGTLLTLTPSTPSITHFVNDSFIIFCRTAQKDISTKWKDSTGAARENTKGRVHIEKKEGLLALVFEHIQISDKGNWTCEALVDGKSSSGADTKKSFELLVNQKISFDNTELIQSAREGRDAVVKCSVKGEPAPVVTWLHNGEHINTVGNLSKHKRLSDGLFIKDVTQADAGEYTCRAMRITQTFSDSDQITILLRIQHKPHWLHNETFIPLQYSYINGTVNISCDAMGEPPPSFTWLHEGQPLTGPNYRHFYADYGTTLQIQVKNESMLGDYKCKVANPLGILERVISLRRGQKPFGPTRFQLRRLFTDGFDLDIRSSKHQNLEDKMHPIGYRVQYMSEKDFKYSAGNWSYSRRRDFPYYHGGRFIISGLERNTTYLLRAATVNIAGLSDWSAVKIFATLSSYSPRSVKQLEWKTTVGLILLAWLLGTKRWKTF